MAVIIYGVWVAASVAGWWSVGVTVGVGLSVGTIVIAGLHAGRISNKQKADRREAGMDDILCCGGWQFN